MLFLLIWRKKKFVTIAQSILPIPHNVNSTIGRLELPSLQFWQWVSTFCGELIQNEYSFLLSFDVLYDQRILTENFSGPSKHNLDQRDDGAQHFWNFPKLQWHLRVGKSSSHNTIHICVSYVCYMQIFSKTLAISNLRAGERGMEIVTSTEHWKSFDGTLSLRAG